MYVPQSRCRPVYVSLAVHFHAASGDEQEGKKETAIDLGPAPCSKGEYTAGDYWLCSLLQ